MIVSDNKTIDYWNYPLKVGGFKFNVMREDRIVQILDPVVDGRIIINNPSQIYNDHYFDNNEKKDNKSRDVFIWWYWMLSFLILAADLKKESIIGDAGFLTMIPIGKKALREIFNVFTYSINDINYKTQVNFQFTSKIQYLLNNKWNKYSFRLELEAKNEGKYGS